MIRMSEFGVRLVNDSINVVVVSIDASLQCARAPTGDARACLLWRPQAVRGREASIFGWCNWILQLRTPYQTGLPSLYARLASPAAGYVYLFLMFQVLCTTGPMAIFDPIFGYEDRRLEGVL